MSALTWRSSWSCTSDGSVDMQLMPDARCGVASLSSLQLTRPVSGVSVPCQVSLLWSPQPLRCTQLQLEVQCSARHVELHAEGTRRNMLGEEDQGEVYLGTFRGSKQSSGSSPEPQIFTMSPAFKQNDRDCDVLKSLQTLKVKFVSLTGDKSVLTLQALRCVFVPMEPVATVDTSAASLAATMAGLGMDRAAGSAPDVPMILKGFQQTLEREMETKIARAIDAKLSTLSQRLSFSEQALFQLHKRMDAKGTQVQDRLAQIQHKFSQLEDQLSQLSDAQKVDKEKDSDGVKSAAMEPTNDAGFDNGTQEELAESEVVAEDE